MNGNPEADYIARMLAEGHITVAGAAALAAEAQRSRDAGESPPPPAEAEAIETVGGVLLDLVEVAERLPVRPDQIERTAKNLDRLAEELAEAAAQLRALPGQPPELPGYSYAAAATVTAAAEAEHDFGGWLAVILCQAAARLGSSGALVMGRSGSWEATHVLGLVRGTAGWADEHLDHYRDGAK